MPSFTLTELNNRSGEVVEAAHAGPVDITSRGKRKFVILTAAQFDRLVGRGGQHVHHLDAMSNAERDEFASAMEVISAASEGVDG